MIRSRGNGATVDFGGKKLGDDAAGDALDAFDAFDLDDAGGVGLILARCVRNGVDMRKGIAEVCIGVGVDTDRFCSLL